MYTKSWWNFEKKSLYLKNYVMFKELLLTGKSNFLTSEGALKT